MGNERREVRIRRRLVRRIVSARQDAVELKLEPAVMALDLALLTTEPVVNDHPPNLGA